MTRPGLSAPGTDSEPSPGTLRSARMRTETAKTYEELAAEVRALQAAGKLPTAPTKEQRIDWAYGQTKMENERVTRDHARRAVDRVP